MLKSIHAGAISGFFFEAWMSSFPELQTDDQLVAEARLHWGDRPMLSSAHLFALARRQTLAELVHRAAELVKTHDLLGFQLERREDEDGGDDTLVLTVLLPAPSGKGPAVPMEAQDALDEDIEAQSRVQDPEGLAEELAAWADVAITIGGNEIHDRFAQGVMGRTFTETDRDFLTDLALGPVVKALDREARAERLIEPPSQPEARKRSRRPT